MKKRKVVYLTVRCVELARRKNAVLVGYNNRELWFTVSLCKEITQCDDGYTRIKVPAWMFKERLDRDIEKTKQLTIEQQVKREYKANQRRKAVLAAANRFGFYDSGAQSRDA